MNRSQSEGGVVASDESLLHRIVGQHRIRMGLLSFVSFGGALLEALFIVLVTAVAMALVDRSTSVGPVFGWAPSLGIALLVAAAALVVRLLFNMGSVWISARLAAEVTSQQRRELSHAYLRSSWAIQQSEPSGRLQELLTSFVARVTQTVSTLTTAVTAALSLAAFLGTGLIVDPVATLAVLIALAVVGAVLFPIRRSTRRRASRNAEANLAFANAVSELGSLGLEMQTFGAERHFEGRIDHLTRATTETQRRTQVMQQSMAYAYLSLAYAALLAGVAVLSLVDAGDLEDVGAVMLLMLRSLSYGQQLATASAALAASAPFLASVRDTVRRYSAQPASGGITRPRTVPPLEAKDLEFRYADGLTPALSGVNFRIDPGEAIGIIGPSGAGKSTLAQLLLGLRSPSSGQLCASGALLDEIRREWWASRVALVAQEPRLFTGTVAENIRFFRTDIDDQRLKWAAQQANVLKDINAMPHGFDTHLGERGSQLSGGQRQRLSIARALAGRPELLVLDEPTSALDGQSEALIRATLARLRGSITIVIIAHRMSTLDICDRIMVIEAGRMTAFGSPADLRSNNEFYRNALAVAGIE